MSEIQDVREYVETAIRGQRVDALARVRTAYDTRVLGSSRVVFVGAGGARAFADDLARTGLGEFVIIDGDTVSIENVGTQQVRPSEVGRPKVECVAEQVAAISPSARIRTVKRMLDDSMDDEELFQLIQRPFPGFPPPPQILLCGFTDSFVAQARLNRVALHLGLPALYAQLYREGRGVEITFTHPDVTPACSRCTLRSRYVSFLSGSHQAGESAGCPIFCTTFLNALKGFVAMALLHHDTDHPRWGALLSRIGSRNLVISRTDPDFGAALGWNLFDTTMPASSKILFGETLWLPQEPDSGSNGFSRCPECLGTGHLRDRIGRIPDTRQMLPYQDTTD